MASTVEQKIKLANQFIVDSPPGEFHEVLNDIRVLIQNDLKLQQGAKTAVHKYNTEQFIVVKLEEEGAHAIISKYGELAENEYYCPKSKQKFIFDHVRQSASEVQPYQPPSDSKLRIAVETEVANYVSEHYPEGQSSVYDYEKKIVILIVSNKYNSGNFWNGRWRSEWTFDPASGSLKGTLRVHVHYYEDGNVQFSSEIQESHQLAADASATAIKQAIFESEAKYQTALNENYAQLSETTFKGLRRALPVTKSKVDWTKILSYKLGNNLSR